MTTIVTIIPIIPVGPRISSRSFPRESQRTAAARSALSPSWVGGRYAAQYSTWRDGSARQPEPSAVVPDESSCFNIGDIESRLPLRGLVQTHYVGVARLLTEFDSLSYLIPVEVGRSSPRPTCAARSGTVGPLDRPSLTWIRKATRSERGSTRAR